MDAVIVAHKKDIETLNLCIDGIRKNIVGVNKDIVVVSETQLTDNAIWYDERNFPFKKLDVAAVVGEKRAGWYFQQLLKLYSILMIPKISEKIIIVDADAVFLNNTVIDGFIVASKMHKPYFDHMNLLLPGLVKQVNYSGVVHWMIFLRYVVLDLMKKVEAVHQKPFWKAYLDCVDPKDYKQSGAAEYEVYFHFMLANYKDYKLQEMKRATIHNLNDIENYRKQGYAYVVSHSYLRVK